jgi:mannose-1-phosphate guanylyltransferase
MSERRFAVILAGGKGERFWPLSRLRRPKQLLDLVDRDSLLASAVKRLEGLVPASNIFVITGADLVAPAAESLPGFPAANLVGEPVGRDTAAAIALGAALVKARRPDAAFAVLTADHVIHDVPAFQRTLADMFQLALERDLLLTIGIPPTFPCTGFGYIEAGAPIPAEGATAFVQARRFVEKPSPEKAAEYVRSGRYAWNGGMFLWTLAAFEKALAAHCPDLAVLVRRLVPLAGRSDLTEALRPIYEPLPRISIDYALMEKAGNVAMAKAGFDWDDVGAWPALANHFPADAQGNVVVGRGAVLDASGNIAVGRGGLVALLGVRDLVVVHAGDAVLVCPRDRAQDVKKLVALLAEQGGHADVL